MTAQAILDLDEHWNGQGQPRGLRGEEISLAGRIAGLAQTFEVFYTKLGLTAALEMTLARSGTWFDPTLVSLLHGLAAEDEFRSELARRDADVAVACYEPHDMRSGFKAHKTDFSFQFETVRERHFGIGCHGVPPCPVGASAISEPATPA